MTVPDMSRVVAAIDRWQTGQLNVGQTSTQLGPQRRRPLPVREHVRVGDQLPLGLYQVGDNSLP